MNITRYSSLFFLVCGVAAIAANAAVPEVTGVTMLQDDRHREVTIQYTFTGADAVITLDVQTNYLDGAETKWASIGGEAICNAQGDVWKKVVCDGSTHTISWRPDLSWPDHKVRNSGARAVVTAWSLDNTPDYMVVDISSSAQANSQRYYPAADFLPGSAPGQRGAVTNNAEYKVSKLVMRKIMAKDVAWTAGTITASYPVCLTNNYYIGVFEVTQGQWNQVKGQWPSYFTNKSDRVWRPVERIGYNIIRMSNDQWWQTGTTPTSAQCEWPKAPYPTSFLGVLRSRTGLDFDLPGEHQWEFACRAGHGETFWGDGSAVLGNTASDANLGRLARYAGNWAGYTTSPDRGIAASAGGTAVVGSFAPNSWGLYDMHGNVLEITIDAEKPDGNINAKRTAGGAILVGSTTTYETARIVRGGGWRKYNTNVGDCRPYFSWGHCPWIFAADGPEMKYSEGFRVVCRAGLE